MHGFRYLLACGMPARVEHDRGHVAVDRRTPAEPNLLFGHAKGGGTEKRKRATRERGDKRIRCLEHLSYSRRMKTKNLKKKACNSYRVSRERKG